MFQRVYCMSLFLNVAMAVEIYMAVCVNQVVVNIIYIILFGYWKIPTAYEGGVWANFFFPPHLFPHEVQLSLLTVLYWPVSRYAWGRA